MLEKLKEQREVYVAELEQLKQTDLEAIIAERFEQIKEQIALEVKKELNDKLAEVELKISHYDFVIAEEEKLAEVVAEEVVADEVIAEDVISDVTEQI